ERREGVCRGVGMRGGGGAGWSGGPAFIIRAGLGEVNRPEPKPLRATMSANSQYGKSTGRKSSKTKLSAVSSAPPTVNALAPNRSDSTPDVGAERRKPNVSGSR